MRSNLNVQLWKQELATDTDKDFLLSGIERGFHIIEQDAQLQPSEFRNHKSATDAGVRHQVEKLITKEIALGNYVVTSQKPTIISAIGSVPKSDGGIRLIHDCSLPVDRCLNSYAPTFDKQSYESVDTAVSLIKPCAYMAKIDIKSAYRNVPIHPFSQHATGLQWDFENGQHLYLYDSKLPFGGRASPTIFHRISQAIKRMMERRGHHKVVAYQDDFLLVGDTLEECQESWTVMKDLIVALGFPLNEKKLVAPTQTLEFLGICIDTTTCTLSLPQDKLDDIRHILSQHLQSKRITKQHLQSIAGKLNFAAKCVRGARTFLRRILNAIQTLKRPHHKLRLQGAVKHDMVWWFQFIEQFNGVVPFIDDRPVSPIMTDACTHSGGAVFQDGDFYFTNWPMDHPELYKLPINYKEAAIAALAVLRWGHLCKDRIVHLLMDNQCAVSLINKCAAKSATLMVILRQMFWQAAVNNFVVKAFYVPGKSHNLADAASRLHEQGQLLRLEAEWNTAFGHTNNFCNVNMLAHMSLASLCVIFPQVHQWRKLNGFWTPMCASTEELCSPKAPRPVIGVR